MELDELKLTAELAGIRLREGDLERLADYPSLYGGQPAQARLRRFDPGRSARRGDD
jgi:hypothetical protein